MKPELHERKWEIDSLCYPVRLAHGYWKATGDASCFDQTGKRPPRSIVQDLPRAAADDRTAGPIASSANTASPRTRCPAAVRQSDPSLRLIHSGFRPSDDACIFPFLIPANLFAVTSLEQLPRCLRRRTRTTQPCRASAATWPPKSRRQLRRYGKATSSASTARLRLRSRRLRQPALHGRRRTCPACSRCPTSACVTADDPRYRNTRRIAAERRQPVFFRGTRGRRTRRTARRAGHDLAAGHHHPRAHQQRPAGNRRCLATLEGTHAGTGFMHESFTKRRQTFTRKWFAWANTLFGRVDSERQRYRLRNS